MKTQCTMNKQDFIRQIILYEQQVSWQQAA